MRWLYARLSFFSCLYVIKEMVVKDGKSIDSDVACNMTMVTWNDLTKERYLIEV